MKIGIYGGTFNPPHTGHINACKSFLEALELDKLYVIPAYLPPHKEINSSTTTENRYEMSKLAFAEISDKIEISDVEIKRKGKSYTAHTISYFKGLGYDDIYFLCGTDMLLTFDEWYKPDYIFQNATIVYARREKDEKNNSLIPQKIKLYNEKYGAKIITLNLEVMEISSSDIRKMVKNNEPCEFLSDEVFSYIQKNNLYR